MLKVGVAPCDNWHVEGMKFYSIVIRKGCMGASVYIEQSRKLLDPCQSNLMRSTTLALLLYNLEIDKVERQPGLLPK